MVRRGLSVVGRDEALIRGRPFVRDAHVVDAPLSRLPRTSLLYHFHFFDAKRESRGAA